MQLDFPPLPQILSLGLIMIRKVKREKGRFYYFSCFAKTMYHSYDFIYSHIFNVCVPAAGWTKIKIPLLNITLQYCFCSWFSEAYFAAPMLKSTTVSWTVTSLIQTHRKEKVLNIKWDLWILLSILHCIRVYSNFLGLI